MYSTELWCQWTEKESKNYELLNGKKIYHKKAYLHFDQRFWFPIQKNIIEEIIKNNLRYFNISTSRIEYHSFSPFIKLLIKTPRYRYQFEEGHYDLETKVRPISFASHIDSNIWSFYSFALTKKYEEYIKFHNFDDSVLAYRTDLKKCNIQFSKEVFDLVKKKEICSTVALDIKGYFDNIDHILLKEKWQKILGGLLPEDQFRLFKIITRYSYSSATSILKKYKGEVTRGHKLPATLMDIVPGDSINNKFKKLKSDNLITTNTKPSKITGRLCGIPQGSPISALLSNIYLIDFDKYMKNKSEQEGFIYKRYCDDILIICDTDHSSVLMNFIINKISTEYFLKIQPSKVEITDFHHDSEGIIKSFKRQKRKIGIGSYSKTIISDKPAKTSNLNEKRFYKPLQYLGFEYDGNKITIRSSSLSRFFRKLNYGLTRTVTMAHSPKTKSDQIYLRQIYERYTHLGKKNFITYALKASKNKYEDSLGNLKSGMNSTSIKRQISKHFALLRHELGVKNQKWFLHKLKGNKKVTPKYFK